LFSSLPFGNPQGLKAPLAPLLRAAMDNGQVSAELYDRRLDRRGHAGPPGRTEPGSHHHDLKKRSTMSTTTIYEKRRAAVARALKAAGGGIALLPTAREYPRNRDSDFPYRHDSYFYYLTGFERARQPGW
jgi:hypothetical protein